MQTRESKPSTANQPATATPSIILLVEDEAVVRDITAQVLNSAGYRVLQTGSPGEALRVAGEHAGRIDLLLTDVIMPEMNGVDLAERIRRLRPDVTTVFMSGDMESDVSRKARNGSAMHIQKPFTVNSLLSRIAEALRASLRRGDAECAAVSTPVAKGPANSILVSSSDKVRV